MRALITSLLLTLAMPASASDCLVITGASVHLPDGPVQTDLRLDGDNISAIGAVNAENCDTIDGAGQTVTAGFVGVLTHLGLVEIGLESGTRDEAGSGSVNAALRVADAYNPRSAVIGVQRVEGITSSVVVPGGGFISGQAAWADLVGGHQANAVRDPSIAIVANIHGYGSRAESLLRLRELMDDARAYRANRSSFDRNAYRELSASRLDLAALIPVLDGDVPLILNVDRAADIEAALRLGRQEKITLVLAGGAEAWLVADQLAETNTAVIVDPLIYGPGGFEQIHARPDNAALLVAAGVDVMFSDGSSHNVRTVPQLAGNAVRGGLAHADALEAVTATPARVFGQGTGQIAVGARANLVLWSGDPFELSTKANAVIIGGQSQPMNSRQTELRDRYRTLPGTPVAPLPLP